MEKWFSNRSGMSNGELLCLGVGLFIAGRLLATPDPEAQAKTALFAAGAAAGAATGAAQPAAPAQIEAPTEQTPASWGYEQPDVSGYSFGLGRLNRR
ncbi:MAG: hypothetical protein QOH49_2499 [Acidobacteriota bacterium]|jgi:hypothetical protein|nr:hypothetical protein [Acidobacteriota bacterium]